MEKGDIPDNYKLEDEPEPKTDELKFLVKTLKVKLRVESSLNAALQEQREKLEKRIAELERGGSG